MTSPCQEDWYSEESSDKCDFDFDERFQEMKIGDDYYLAHMKKFVEIEDEISELQKNDEDTETINMTNPCI